MHTCTQTHMHTQSRAHTQIYILEKILHERKDVCWETYACLVYNTGTEKKLSYGIFKAAV